MGTWGTAIFSDDLAADVRSDWRDAIARGASPEQATQELLVKHGGSITDQDDGPKFWFALAASQAATGRLLPDVRDRALALIDDGGDIESFASESAKLGHQREAVLAKLAATLRGPQRSPTRIVQPKAQPSPVSVGDLVRVPGQGRTGGCYFVVIGLSDGWPKGTKWPVMVGLLWGETRDPDGLEAARVPLLRDSDGLDELRRVPADPMVHVLTVGAPSRGPRSWDKFGSVIARGISRRDAPNLADDRASHKTGFFVTFVSWETLGFWAGGGDDWYARVATLTQGYLDKVPTQRRKWPWQRD